MMLTADKIVGSLVTICPKARRAFVRMKTGGASRAARMTFNMGWNELFRPCMAPMSSEIRSIRTASSCVLCTQNEAKSDYGEEYTYPTLNTSVAWSFQTSLRVNLIFAPKESRFLRSCFELIASSSGSLIKMSTCFIAWASSCPHVAAVSSRALCNGHE